MESLQSGIISKSPNPAVIEHQPSYHLWQALSEKVPQSLTELKTLLLQLRSFEPIDQLQYGDHGLGEVLETILLALKNNKRIALYADYDVDGTMSCVSWIWFLQSIGYSNFVHYIPCRFQEGYGVNLAAIQRLIHEEKADVIITMDTGITANDEAAYCRENGVIFICTDHHKIQPDKMPDCMILNPKTHTDPNYQELCGCGVTFVLLRKLGQVLGVQGEIWRDLLALAGMATICDVVTLNPVNHRLARLGVQALTQSKRPVLRKLIASSQVNQEQVDEQSIGFRLGPRINAVGRLNHANAIVKAFVEEDPDELIAFMGTCNEERRRIQEGIVETALAMARDHLHEPVLFLGHRDWHAGVIGIAASKLAEQFWRPVWLYQETDDGLGKGSARSIPGFDVTEAMQSVGARFKKFGGHQAAGGFSFELHRAADIKQGLLDYALQMRSLSPDLWVSSMGYDCELSFDLLQLPLLDILDDMRPFGMGFREPRFSVRGRLEALRYLNDRETGQPKHSKWRLREGKKMVELIMFHKILPKGLEGQNVDCLVQVSRNVFRGQVQVSVMAQDVRVRE